MSRTNRDLNLQTPQNSALESTAKDLQPAPSPRVILVNLVRREFGGFESHYSDEKSGQDLQSGCNPGNIKFFTPSCIFPG